MIFIEMEDAFYSNVDPRRKQELSDARQLYEDHSAVANLSPDGFQRQFNPDKYVEKLNMYNQSQRMKRI